MDLKDVLVGENDEWFSWLHPALDHWPSFLLSCTSQAPCTGLACTERGHAEFSDIFPPFCTENLDMAGELKCVFAQDSSISLCPQPLMYVEMSSP